MNTGEGGSTPNEGTEYFPSLSNLEFGSEAFNAELARIIVQISSDIYSDSFPKEMARILMVVEKRDPRKDPNAVSYSYDSVDFDPKAPFIGLSNDLQGWDYSIEAEVDNLLIGGVANNLSVTVEGTLAINNLEGPNYFDKVTDRNVKLSAV